MGGKRFDEEPKLNKKKVFSVILGILVIIMFGLTLSKLLQDGTNLANKKTEEPNKYFSVYTDYKWGVINQKGDYVIEPTYDEMIIVPDENSALFACTYDVNYQDETYKTKIINEKGETLFTNYDIAEFIVNYDESNVLWYENNVIKVQKDGKFGMINFEGRELLKCEYDSIVALNGVKNTFIVSQDGKVGLSDSFGNIIVDIKYKEIKPLGEDNRKEFIIINEENKQGVALSNNTIEIECLYEEIKPISVNNIYVVKENGNWQIIDSDKTVNITEGFNDVIEIAGENFVILKDNKYGVINQKGEELIPAEYDKLKYAYGDNFVAQKDEKYGVINLQNETKIEFTYDELIYRTDSDLFVATIGEEAPQIIDREFNEKLTGIISKVDSKVGYIKIRTEGEYKYYNFKFEEKQNTEIFPNNTLFLSKKDGKYGYINNKGEVVVDYIYDDATEQNEYGYVSVNKGGKWGCLDKEGKVVLEPTYTLQSNTIIDFIGKWHFAEDANANYYTDVE